MRSGEAIVCRSVETAGGFMALAYTITGLYALELPQAQCKDGYPAVGQTEPAWLQKLAADLGSYFKGEPVSFDCPLDLDLYSPFFKEVLTVCAKIAYGQRRSYGWLAAEAGIPKAARAVGQAMAKNRTPLVIPCHRVLRSDGGLGGFSGGLFWKEKLLALEAGAQV
ncbi:MAG: methylated-DNA--[protein]-cysteine S-methyltransferase [Dethiobacter sp.]|nr:methylated-DNA--[protein]-cysteine S-methyltransferase [Dethiobacter sp.]MBS3900793.1 methylated-DNA--[protein]-cysteine S-methyltransferase [Dethiobacter sp.]MBS3988759.1 methylated-DNA--[protein]-cysteine S-methyltransferase [Dethiobacter sp.]